MLGLDVRGQAKGTIPRLVRCCHYERGKLLGDASLLGSGSVIS